MSVDEKTLLRLRDRGAESLILGLRLQYAEIMSALKYLRPLAGTSRVHPSMLPTQKSGRWSTKNPPLPNWSQECINPACGLRDEGVHIVRSKTCWSLRDIVGPDPGWYWLKWDYDAIEARIGAAYSDDVEDLKAFEAGWDLHTITACRGLRLVLPPDLMDPHKAASCAQWREAMRWAGKDDKRRVGFKTARYALYYGSDKTAILQAKDVEKLGLSRDELLDMAARYLKSKPNLVAFKKRTWGEVLRTCEARTFLGRRRRLFPAEGELATWMRTHRATPSAREGLNHLFQGAVSGIMNRALRVITQRWPVACLAYQTHDGAQVAFPETVECWPEVRELVEQRHTINGHQVHFTATWGRVYAGGGHESL